MKTIRVTADKPVGLVFRNGAKDYLHVSITQAMIDKGESVEVPDNDFFRAKMKEKLLKVAEASSKSEKEDPPSDEAVPKKPTGRKPPRPKKEDTE